MSAGVGDPVVEALEALRALVDADPACAERDDLAELVRCVRQVRGFVDAYDVQIARRSRQLTERDRPQPAPGLPPRPVDPGREQAAVVSMLLSSGCQSGRDAHATAVREAVCGVLPGFEEALAAGHVSAAHLDVLGRLLKGLTEPERVELRDRTDELVRIARREFAEGFAKTVRAIIDEIRHRRRPTSDAEELDRQRAASKITEWVDASSGMHKTLIELDPLRHDEFWRVLDAHIARLKASPGGRERAFQELKVEAFLNAVTAPGENAGSSLVRVPKALVVIDYQTLVNGPHAATIAQLADGTVLPVSTIRRLLCEADIVPVVLSGDGQPLDVGRARRLATAAQRDALEAIYPTCVEIGCPVPFDQCDMHHTTNWEHGGRTDIAALAPLCPNGHHRVHEDGWKLEIHDNHAAITWTRPDGTIEHHGPHPNRRPPPEPPSTE